MHSPAIINVSENLLALDTSGDCCSVALLGRTASIERTVVAPKEHTKFILQMINEVLDEAKVCIGDLVCIAFSHGPGSFTGIRLAASIVQGLAFPHGIPVMGISTLRAIAQEILETKGCANVLVVQDARMGEIYLGKYVAKEGIMQPLASDAIVKPDKRMAEIFSEEFVMAGSGYELCKEMVRKMDFIDLSCAQARYIARLAYYDIISGVRIEGVEKAIPIYLRNEIVTLQ